MPTLSWLTRDADIGASSRAPWRLLEEAPELSGGAADARNMLIQGDNLEALKALLPYYANRVKCVYIDPPYNTRSAFAHYQDNLEHAKWLAMMWPRLELLRDLLAEDGSIWVSIDDNEAHYLKVVIDEVFGRKNFIDTIIWRKNYSPKSSTRHFSSDHDYILVFAKSADAFRPNLMPRTERQNKAYRNPDDDPRGPWKTSDLSARNPYSLGIYGITTPGGRVIEGPPKGRYWVISEEKMQQFREDNRIWWGKDKNAIPQIKRFLSEVRDGRVPQTLWPYEEVGHTQDAKKEVVSLFGGDVFGTPKPERLIQRVLHIATNPGDLVLDSFLGSGTTAAVAHKMGRRWIGIEMGEHAVTHCAPRLRKVTAGERGGVSEAVGWQGGGGFRFHRLGPAAFDADGRILADIPFAVLAAHLWFAEAGQPWDAPANLSPFLGAHDGRGVALLYNGVLRDRSARGGNVLTKRAAALIREAAGGFRGPVTVYAARSTLSGPALAAAGLTFRQTPYEVTERG